MQRRVCSFFDSSMCIVQTESDRNFSGELKMYNFKSNKQLSLNKTSTALNSDLNDR